MSAYDLDLARPLAAWTARMAPVSGRLAVIDVTDRADVDVRLGACEMCPWPCCSLTNNNG